MNKLIIDYLQIESEQIEYLDGGRIDKYENHGRGIGYKPNPGAWCFGPYERYLAIDVDMEFMRPSRVAIDREICAVEIFNEGTYSEYYTFKTTRRKTMHLLDQDELGAVWPQIDMHKMAGTRIRISEPKTILRDPWEVSAYYGI
ncbi:hypothetical protein [Paraburkholderia graminis]|uniref:hypothetical protein n=1 Tax=Paraburkholderia graminis TaxID=60548 RepID=UPI0038BC140F